MEAYEKEALMELNAWKRKLEKKPIDGQRLDKVISIKNERVRS